jgi:hypothetical protein
MLGIIFVFIVKTVVFAVYHSGVYCFVNGAK